MSDWLTAWGDHATLAACPVCDTHFLLPPDVDIDCPLCGNGRLQPRNPLDDQPAYTRSPELLLPVSSETNRLHAALTRLVKKTPLAADDMTPDRLAERLRLVYWPIWLVDANVQSRWQAEVGFDYEAVTYQEKYRDGRWVSTEQRETRIRWEPRVGDLSRHYANQRAPALEEHLVIARRLGDDRDGTPEPFVAARLETAVVCLPNRPPDDAWSDAQQAFQQAAAQEVRQATEAHHVRDYRWSPTFADHHWTQLLMPLLTTFYLDDQGQKRMVYINGRSHRLVAEQVASMKKARRIATGIGVLALLLLTTALILLVASAVTNRPELAEAVGLFLVATAGVSLTAVSVPLYAWYANTFQFTSSAQEIRRSFLENGGPGDG